MSHLALVAVFCLGLGLASAQEQKGCPDAVLITPCLCDYFPNESRSDLVCHYINDGVKLQSILSLFKDYEIDLNINMFVKSVNNFTFPENLFPAGKVRTYNLFAKLFYSDPIPLGFHANSMVSEDGLCKLTGFWVDGFALGHLDAAMFANCTDMVIFDTYFSGVETITNFPQLNKLDHFSIKFRKNYPPTNDVTAAKIPNIKRFRWAGDPTADQNFFKPFLNLPNLQRAVLYDNSLSQIPDLSAASELVEFNATTDQISADSGDLIINLPIVNSQLQLAVKSDEDNGTFTVSTLTGPFRQRGVTFGLHLDKLDEAVFKVAIQQGLTIYLGYAIPFDCDLAWVVRQLDFNQRNRIIGEAIDHGQIAHLKETDFAFCQ